MTQDTNTEQDLGLDDDLLAYVDGTLSPEKMAQVEARLARDPEARAATASWRHHDNLIREMAQTADDLPTNMRIAALERELAAKLQARKRRAFLMGPALGRIAASVLIFTAGWGAHGLFSSSSQLRGAEYPQFVSATLTGHYALQYASKQQAEFQPEELDMALDWMSERMQRKIDSPKLERLGYEVESARLVSADSGPLAIFHFRDGQGERVTVSITPHAPDKADYALRVVQMDTDSMAYWTDAGLDYSIIGEVDVGRITTLAAAVRD
ncbi:anti-sigma factor family protein [Roseinatronobacter monicus]|uniref:Anti-sigma factor RsiW n=1 Tax=Roseinatronobacter monicus TaxID=393481 RepID=A0A543KGD6_9RHOB|nr:anti-sigma factor [Roseinatronobacter monicus]TQM94158.1 anti-sigma factor RsiW [Roseinatronobacter monicus]